MKTTTAVLIGNHETESVNFGVTPAGVAVTALRMKPPMIFAAWG